MGNTTKIERIQLIAKRENSTLKDFANVFHVRYRMLTQAILGKGEIPDSFISKIIDIFPEYSSHWLMTGEGEMLVSEKENNGELAQHLNGSKTDNLSVPAGIRLTGRGKNAETSDGWTLQQIMPTDRHYILLQEPEGMDYLMADAVLLFSKVENGSMQVRPVGINYKEASELQEYWLEEVDDKIISDELEMQTLESMIRYKVDACNHAREEAILAIKSDFERTKVRLDPDVRHLFDSYEDPAC